MGSFPLSLYGHSYILVVVDYISKRVEAIVNKTNDAPIILKFLHKIFSHVLTH